MRNTMTIARRELRLAVEQAGGALLELRRDALSLEDVFRRLTVSDDAAAAPSQSVPEQRAS